MKYFYIFIFFTSLLFSKNIDYSQEAIIVLEKNPNDINIFAAQELQKHLQLILKQKILFNTNEDLNNFNYVFYIGSTFYKNNQENESNYIIENNKIYLFGDDKIIKKENSPLLTSLNMRNKTGTLFSIYDFLYAELGVRWIRPGDDGIIYKELEKLNLNDKSFSWNSDYSFRILRNDIWDYKKFINKLKMNEYTPKELQFSKEEVEKIEQDELLWKRRMKLDTSTKPSYGHAFTKYWEKYGNKHPEWFALGENGERGVHGFSKLEESRQKFCVSNISLQNEIVNNWKKDYEKNGNNIYNASINDSRGYCSCANCKLLDSKDHVHEDFQEKAKTDRYVYFWNSLLKKAKEFNPNAKLIAYAYSDYRYPPKNINLSENVILGFVPKFNDLPSETKIDLEKWKDKGLKEIFLRPNDFNDDIGLPMGHEKYIFDKFKLFEDRSILGLDYDNAYSFNDWNLEGISRYILIQSFNNPEKNFEEIEDEYFQIFGSSKNDVRKYYKYWQKNFETKRLPTIEKAGGFHGRKFLYQNINDFYTKKDFENTNEILKNALKNANSKKVRKIIENIIISNNHAKLIFETYSSNVNFKNNYKKLINYRIQYKENLSLCWPQVFNTEKRLNSNTYLRRIFLKILDNFE
jgi:hypothetical protein